MKDRAYWTEVQPFVFSMVSKAQVVNQLKLAIELLEVKLLSQDQLGPDGKTICSSEARKLCRLAYSEVGNYVYDRTPSGLLRMNAQEGKHDDVVIALVLAYEMALRSVGGSPIVVQAGEQSAAPILTGHFVPKGPAAKPVPIMRKRRTKIKRIS